MFTLINIESATLLSERIKLDDGRKAARAARLLSLKTKQRFQPRKIESTDDSTWHKREEERFLSGEYIPLVEQLNHEAGIYELTHNVRLFAHVSKKNPELIAYTKDAIKGAQDKQSIISIKAFIDLISNKDNDTKDYLRLLQLNWARDNTPAQFKIATTADEIESVYINYDLSVYALKKSCMRFRHEPCGEYDETARWPRVDGKPFHPVRAYAGGDLTVAYMTNSEGKTIARAIIHQDRKLYSRMYADSDLLHKALQDAGYSKSSYYGTGPSLDGARLSLIESDSGAYIAPYLDEIGRARISNGFFVLDSDGDYMLQDTGGVAEERNSTCDSCGDSFNEDDLTTVYTRSNMNQSEQWCEYCRGNNAFYCEGEREYFSDSVDSTIINDEHYTSRYAENHAHFCEYYEEYTFDDPTTVIVDSDGETQQWSESAIENHAYEYEGDYYSKDVDYERVIVERYCVQFARRWNRDSGWYESINAYYIDRTEKIPTHLIDEGSVDVVEAPNGRYYLKNYVDHYPVERERLDVVDAIIVESIAA